MADNWDKGEKNQKERGAAGNHQNKQNHTRKKAGKTAERRKSVVEPSRETKWPAVILTRSKSGGGTARGPTGHTSQREYKSCSISPISLHFSARLIWDKRRTSAHSKLIFRSKSFRETETLELIWLRLMSHRERRTDRMRCSPTPRSQPLYVGVINYFHKQKIQRVPKTIRFSKKPYCFIDWPLI